MITSEQIRTLPGHDAVDETGEKIGSIGNIYLDDDTGEPSWATVKTGLFGMSESFVPLSNATLSGDTLRVGYTKDTVKDAPRVEADGHLEPGEEQALYRYYGLDYSGGTTTGTAPSGTATGEPDDAMTRSEEHLKVDKAQEQAGRARLRKYVVTEEETVTVPVKKERAVLETEPITSENRGEALDGPAITDNEHEVVLNEERAVVDKEATPVERVRLGKETVTEEETVTEQVRKEQIEAEGDIKR